MAEFGLYVTTLETPMVLFSKQLSVIVIGPLVSTKKLFLLAWSLQARAANGVRYRNVKRKKFYTYRFSRVGTYF